MYSDRPAVAPRVVDHLQPGSSASVRARGGDAVRARTAGARADAQAGIHSAGSAGSVRRMRDSAPLRTSSAACSMSGAM